SSAASGSTTASSEPERNTTACKSARSSGSTPSSSGINGKSAAPSGTSRSSSAAAISASGHRRDDRQLVAVFHRRVHVAQVTAVLVVEMEVDEAAPLPVLEDPARDGGDFLARVVEHGLARPAAGFHRCLAVGVLPHRRGYLNLHRHMTSPKLVFKRGPVP